MQILVVYSYSVPTMSSDEPTDETANDETYSAGRSDEVGAMSSDEPTVIISLLLTSHERAGDVSNMPRSSARGVVHEGAALFVSSRTWSTTPEE